LDPIERVRLYSDIRGTVEGRQFAEGCTIVDKLSDGRDDRSADVGAFTNDAQSATEILAAFLFDELGVAVVG